MYSLEYGGLIRREVVCDLPGRKLQRQVLSWRGLIKEIHKMKAYFVLLQKSEFGVQNSEFKIWDSEFRIRESEFRIRN